jgi:hypothetical protein
MSKQVGAQITCPHCGKDFPVHLYRSLWIEHPENRALVFNDEVNCFACPQCKEVTRIDYPFLCTNVREGFAVWYEPYHDPQIDADIREYKKHMGENSFYALAPRVSGWQAFKDKITEFEATAKRDEHPVTMSREMKSGIRGFLRSLSRK